MNALVVKDLLPEGEFDLGWDEFESKIRELREPHVSKRVVSPMLFRGQGDANWGLLTTLERRTKGMLLWDYYSVINKIKPQIEAYTRARPHMEDANCQGSIGFGNSDFHGKRGQEF